MLNRDGSRFLQKTVNRYKSFLKISNVDEGHGINHANVVLEHAINAILLDNNQYPQNIKLNIMLASLLHDADDEKFFKSKTPYENAIKIITETNQEFYDEKQDNIVSEPDIADIVEMISLVSTSKNKNTLISESYKLIPRWCDRLEAIGLPGIQRAIIYNRHVKAPIFIEGKTPLVTNDDELNVILAGNRFENYNGGSESLIDHFYDKILHIALTPKQTNNKYLLKTSMQREQILKEFIFEFGKTKKIDYEKYKIIS